MLIGIDGNEANVKNRVGIGEYAFELIKQFEQFKCQNLKFEVFLKEEPLPHMPGQSENWRYKVFGPKKMWTQFALPLKLFLGKRPDIFFSPSHYGPRLSPIPSAISIMDMSFIYFPQLFNKNDLYQLTNWTEYSAKKADLIFTISNASKNDIIKLYKTDPKKVIVTYPGIKELSDNTDQKNKMEEIKKKFNIRNKYILFVGTLQPRKNIKKLIEAYASIKKDLKDIDLLIVGKRGWMFDEILDTPKKIGVEKNVLFLEFVSDSDLPLLYQNAECFVLPSLYEGFGLPVLEAMKYGCPVLASNVSSLPEAGGDAAIYFNPENIKDIADKIKTVLTDNDLRKKMKEKGFKQVKKFSWENTARQTLDALTKLAG